MSTCILHREVFDFDFRLFLVTVIVAIGLSYLAYCWYSAKWSGEQFTRGWTINVAATGRISLARESGQLRTIYWLRRSRALGNYPCLQESGSDTRFVLLLSFCYVDGRFQESRRALFYFEFFSLSLAIAARRQAYCAEIMSKAKIQLLFL